MDQNLFSLITEFSRKCLSDDDIHGFKHTQRVYDLCIKMGKELAANIEVLKISALLHDIGRNKRNQKTSDKNHAEVSAEMAQKFLEQNNQHFSEIRIDEIIHAIRAHSFSNNVKPHTLEAKILSDADKLDALGSIGLYRTIGFTIKNGGNLEDVISHLNSKILKLKDLLYLDISKVIGIKRHKLVKNFLNQLKDELGE